MFRRLTLRRMSPESRKVAKLINELESVSNRLHNLLPKIEAMESDSKALWGMNRVFTHCDLADTCVYKEPKV